jgi:UDP-N-acetylmuramoyl-L-alanyl-D-glutamate--2,6-diaminopimelate ligase
MKLEKLLKAVPECQGKSVRDQNVTGVHCDSRQVRAGGLFVAIRGTASDGLSFVDDAVGRGAVFVVAERAVRVPKTVGSGIVPDARAALARLATAFHGQPSRDLTLVGITGTNGKTTTAYMMRSILRAAGRLPGLISTVEYEMGARTIPAARTTPEAPLIQSLLAQMLTSGCRSAVMEVSSHALDQKRTLGIDFDVGVFTNLTRDHLDYHGDMARYFKAKSLLFQALSAGTKPGTAVINRDDPWGERLLSAPYLPARVVTYGEHPGADVRAESVVLSGSGTAFTIAMPSGRFDVRMRLLGRFNVSNALAAVATSFALGLDIAEACGVIAHQSDVPGRLQAVETGRGFHVFVDYAHTDDALKNVLETLREITPRKLVVVFGCGGNRDRTKRPAMGRIATELADFAILTSDNPRQEEPAAIIEEIAQGVAAGGHYRVVEDRRDAIVEAVAMAEPGDTVLIAGKGHETFQEFANKTVPFDDRSVVRSCL